MIDRQLIRGVGAGSLTPSVGRLQFIMAALVHVIIGKAAARSMFVAGSATRRLHTHRTVSGARWTAGAVRVRVRAVVVLLSHYSNSTGDDVEGGTRKLPPFLPVPASACGRHLFSRSLPAPPR